jgi:hypothetical protein
MWFCSVVRSTTLNPSVYAAVSSSYPPGTLAALALSGILLFILASFALFYLLLWRGRVRRIQHERRAAKQKDRNSGEIVVIEREKIGGESGNRVFREALIPSRGPALPERQRSRDIDVFDAPPFRFSPGIFSKQTDDSFSQSYSVSLDPSPTSPMPKPSSSEHTPQLATLSNAALTNPSSARRPKLGHGREVSDKRPKNVASETSPVISSPTDVQSHLSLQDSTPSVSSQICSDCQVTPIPNTNNDAQSGEILTGPSVEQKSSSGTESVKNSEDDELEYVDLDRVGDDNSSSPKDVAQRPIGVTNSGQSEVPQREAEANTEPESTILQDDARVSRSEPFFRFRESSPFRVDFPRHSLKSSRASGSGPTRKRHSGSRVRFQDNIDAAQDPSSPKEDENTDRSVSSNPPPPFSQPTAQLTPSSAPSRLDHGAVTSFLDLTASPAGSLRTHSSSSSSRGNRPPERSRWSSTTSQSVYTNPSMATGNVSQRNDESRLSIPASSSHLFPFRFSIHAPHIQRQSEPSQNLPSEPRSPSEALSTPIDVPTRGAHPFTISESASLPSPTHSVPTTISDLHFRHSESDDASRAGSRRASTGSHLPPHPPLPGGFPDNRGHQRERSSLSFVSSALISQPNIVQRVLGLGQGSNPAAHTSSTSRSSSMTPTVPMSPNIPRRFRPG